MHVIECPLELMETKMNAHVIETVKGGSPISKDSGSVSLNQHHNQQPKSQTKNHKTWLLQGAHKGQTVKVYCSLKNQPQRLSKEKKTKH